MPHDDDDDGNSLLSLTRQRGSSPASQRQGLQWTRVACGSGVDPM